MTHFLPSNAADAVLCRFMPGDASFEGAFRDALAADMRAAHLSREFRIYYRMRSLIPPVFRRLLQRYRGIDVLPRWYFPDEFVAAMEEELSASCEGLTTIHPWPDGAELSVVLTHDVETVDGLRNVPRIAELEEALGFRSAWNIVPHKYPLDWGLLRDLQGRGFELGVHGFNHDGRLFASREVFHNRVPAINAALEAFGAVGFRSPMVQRNFRWQQALNIDYDASSFDRDPFQPMPGGVGSVWPFTVGRFVELPYTLPQDHTLLIALKEQSGRIWSEKLAYLAKLNGMALLITHPDYLNSPQSIDIYRRFLHEVRELAGVWQALPRDVSAWWRKREATSLVRELNGTWHIRGPAADRARAVQIRTDGDPVNPEICFSSLEWPMAAGLQSTVEWNGLASRADLSAQTVHEI